MTTNMIHHLSPLSQREATILMALRHICIANVSLMESLSGDYDNGFVDTKGRLFVQGGGHRVCVDG